MNVNSPDRKVPPEPWQRRHIVVMLYVNQVGLILISCSFPQRPILCLTAARGLLRQKQSVPFKKVQLGPDYLSGFLLPPCGHSGYYSNIIQRRPFSCFVLIVVIKKRRFVFL